MKLSLLPQKLYSYFFERYLGIETTGLVGSVIEGGGYYVPLPYLVINQILARLAMGKEDVFVDIGCGKGRVLCCACRKPLRKVVGIEVNESLVKLALANANRVRRKKTEVQVLAMPAEEFDYADTTAIYLYNPFGPPIMDKVFARIDESYRRKPRKLQVAYANCLHEEPLRRTGWLVKREEWPASKFPGFGCPISFWTSDFAD